jgi:hypothetical protein
LPNGIVVSFEFQSRHGHCRATAIASFLVVLASRVPLLSVVPATFYGFASTFAYVSLAPGAFTIDAMTRLNGQNALVVVPISLLIGTGLGAAHAWLAKVLAPERPGPRRGARFASMARPRAASSSGQGSNARG